jgi:hypothetical protein
MAYTDDPEEGIMVLISQKKWDKLKRLLKSLMTKLEESLWVDHKKLEKTQGFLIYVSRIFLPMTPFLKDLHLTIDAWCPKRDEEIWRMAQAKLDASKETDEDSGRMDTEEKAREVPPERILAVPRLNDDIKVLFLLTEAECPPLNWIRAHSKASILYCFGDASGGGFGWIIDI